MHEIPAIYFTPNNGLWQLCLYPTQVIEQLMMAVKLKVMVGPTNFYQSTWILFCTCDRSLRERWASAVLNWDHLAIWPCQAQPLVQIARQGGNGFHLYCFWYDPTMDPTQDLSILELTLQHSALASRKPLLGADEQHVSRFIAPVVSNIN